MENSVKQYYSELASTYDEDRFGNTYGKYIHKQESIFLKKRLKAKSTLNLGCGTGRFMELAQVGLDISPQMIAEAKRKFPEKHFEVSDGDHMPFENDAFDQIFCMHVFMHLSLDKAIRLLNETSRVLTSEGHFVFDFPSKKRRNLLNKKQESWHGASAYSISELIELTKKDWHLKMYAGILFLPIHRMPKWSRKFFLTIDYLLCHSFGKEYASYLIVDLQKK